MFNYLICENTWLDKWKQAKLGIDWCVKLWFYKNALFTIVFFHRSTEVFLTFDVGWNLLSKFYRTNKTPQMPNV